MCKIKLNTELNQISFFQDLLLQHLEVFFLHLCFSKTDQQNLSFFIEFFCAFYEAIKSPHICFKLVKLLHVFQHSPFFFLPLEHFTVVENLVNLMQKLFHFPSKIIMHAKMLILTF